MPPGAASNSPARAIDREAVADVFHLTTRESEIVALVTSGVDLEAIATRPGIGLGAAGPSGCQYSRITVTVH
jgi:hypothetical protein